MKKYFGSFAVLFVFLTAFASAQNAQQSDAARKADAQFVSDYEAAKKINQDMTDAAARAAERLEKENRPRRIQLEGLTAELQRKMATACADVPQGCRYDETLHVFIPNPKPAAAAVPQEPVRPAPQPSAVTPAPEAKQDDKK